MEEQTINSSLTFQKHFWANFLSICQFCVIILSKRVFQDMLQAKFRGLLFGPDTRWLHSKHSWAEQTISNNRHVTYLYTTNGYCQSQRQKTKQKYHNFGAAHKTTRHLKAEYYCNAVLKSSFYAAYWNVSSCITQDDWDTQITNVLWRSLQWLWTTKYDEQAATGHNMQLAATVKTQPASPEESQLPSFYPEILMTKHRIDSATVRSQFDLVAWYVTVHNVIWTLSGTEIWTWYQAYVTWRNDAESFGILAIHACSQYICTPQEWQRDLLENEWMRLWMGYYNIYLRETNVK
jgi:hypothetical protein